MIRVVLCGIVLSCAWPGAAEAQTAAPGACPAIIATRPTVVPPQRYKAGDVVPPFAVDEPLRWLECPAPEFPSGATRDAKRRSFLFITVDENGAVVDVKPRGAIDPEGYFDAAVAAVRKWRSSTPRWKTLPVRCSFAADVMFDPTPTPAPAEPTPSANPSALITPPAREDPSAPPTPVPLPGKPAPSAPQPSVVEKQAEPKSEPPAAPVVAQTPPQTEPAPKQTAPEPVPPQKAESAPAAARAAATQPPTAPPMAAAQPPAASVPPPQPAPAETTPAPVAAPVGEMPAAPVVRCPAFFILPESQQSRRAYRAGELVPNAYLDQTPNWVECPGPDFSGMPPRTTAVIVMIDDKGAVRDVRPRGQPANALFQRTRAAVLNWKVNPPPRYKSLPVWTSTALDIANDGRSSNAATTAVPLPGEPTSNARSAEPSAPSTEAPYTEEFYYKVKWGFADEFWRLFLKNHWPILRKQIESGRILEVRAEKPVFHATEDGRWDYRVTIVYRSTVARFAPVDTAALERQLFPDQETFRREEQRRFELLLAHWDLPVERVKLEQ